MSRHTIWNKMEKTTWLELRSSIIFKENHVFIEEEEENLSENVAMV